MNTNLAWGLILAAIILILIYLMGKVIFKTRPEESKEYPTPLAWAVDEIYPLFAELDKYFQRMPEDTFRSWCHSQLSGGIAMKIRNHFDFWELHKRYTEGSTIACNTQNEKLYWYLYYQYWCRHPDAMSDVIITRIYRKYHSEHPEAGSELAKFERFKATPMYQPIYPFDIRYPDERGTSSTASSGPNTDVRKG